jgi:hypothetical protein
VTVLSSAPHSRGKSLNGTLPKSRSGLLHHNRGAVPGARCFRYCEPYRGKGLLTPASLFDLFKGYSAYASMVGLTGCCHGRDVYGRLSQSHTACIINTGCSTTKSRFRARGQNPCNRLTQTPRIKQMNQFLGFSWWSIIGTRSTLFLLKFTIIAGAVGHISCPLRLRNRLCHHQPPSLQYSFNSFTVGRLPIYLSHRRPFAFHLISFPES